MTDAKTRGRRSKQRGKSDERYANKALSGNGRYPADTGGLLDVDHDWLAIQVKGGAQPAKALREGLQQAQAGSPVGKLPCVVIMDRSGVGVRRYIAFDLAEYADWNGLGND